MDLADFMNAFSRQEPGHDLTSVGPAAMALFTRIGNESVTRALIASHFWRIFIKSPTYPRVLASLRASPQAHTNARTILVPRNNLDRFDLLVLDPDLPASVLPQTIAVTLNVFSLSDISVGARLVQQEGVAPTIGTSVQELAIEVINSGQPLAVTLAPAPKNERLSVPGSALSVDDGNGTISTAGVIVECLKSAGVIGVTVALHGIGASNSITVDGQTGTVLRTHAVTDSAFISLAAKPSISTITTNGVMSGFAPRGSQPASFVGTISKKRQTVITGWDPQIPSPSLNRQALIYTGRDAQPGDSGAALVTDDDYIVGFAFERSLPGQNPVQCSWVWADSVLNALAVQLL